MKKKSKKDEMMHKGMKAAKATPPRPVLGGKEMLGAKPVGGIPVTQKGGKKKSKKK